MQVMVGSGSFMDVPAGAAASLPVPLRRLKV
jgi:hypothetical protein